VKFPFNKELNFGGSGHQSWLLLREIAAWPFKRSPDALHLLVPILAQKRPETFEMTRNVRQLSFISRCFFLRDGAGGIRLEGQPTKETWDSGHQEKDLLRTGSGATVQCCTFFSVGFCSSFLFCRSVLPEDLRISLVEDQL